MKKIFSVLVSWFLVFSPVAIQALPSGQKVVNGTVGFNVNKNTMNITASNKSIINYNTFNIKSNEIVNFIQPSSNSVVLNRVISANPSSLMGALNANGKVFLINPAGIVFGKNSTVNTNSFLATTLDIKDSDFIGGNYLFSQAKDRLPSYILQQGKITVSPEGFIVLVSPLVKTGGLVFAKAGKIQIGAVDNFYINFDTKGLVKFAYNPQDKTKTDVIISTQVADALRQDVVNNEKVDEAIRIEEKDGVISLVGGSGTALVSGELNTDGDNAGDISIVSQNYLALINKAKLSNNSLAGGGDITLSATSANQAKINIEDDVQISGKNILIEARAQSIGKFDSDNALSNNMSVVGDFIVNMPATPIAYAKAKATSSIDIGNASISGTKIDILSKATSDVSVSATFKVLALSYGKSEAISSLHVRSGAKLNASDDLTLKSEAISKNDVKSKATNLLIDKQKIAQANISLAYSKTLTNSSAIVENGVQIKANNFKLEAIGNTDTSTAAIGSSFSSGTLGTAVAISNSSSDIKAILGGSVNANKVEVNSDMKLERIRTSSSATVGNGLLYKFLLESKGVRAKVLEKLNIFSESKKPILEPKSAVSTKALSSAFVYSEHKNNSMAKIDKKANIQANSDVKVSSNIEYGENGTYKKDETVTLIGDKGIKSIAISEISSSEENPKENTLSGAVVITDVTNNSNAYIDDEAIVDVLNGDIGIYSKIYMGYKINWKNLIAEPFNIKNIKPKGLDLASFREGLFSSYAQSNTAGGDNSLVGTVNVFKLNNTVNAHIGKNTKINQKVASGNGKIEISANNDIDTLNFSGIIGWTYFGSKVKSTGLGGAYLDVRYKNDTLAYIESGSTIKAKSLRVSAIKKSNSLSIATAGGKAKNAISGSFSVLKTDDNTYAYIDNASIVTSDSDLKVNAKNNTILSNKTGGIVKGEHVGIGASGSYNVIARDTKAYIKGSNIQSAIKDSVGSNYIGAYNDGFISAYAISGTILSSSSSKPKSDAKFGLSLSGDGSLNEIKDKATAYLSDTIFTNSLLDVQLLAKNSTAIGAYSGSVAFNFTNKSLGLAGSYAGNYFSNEANAYVKNSTLGVHNLDIKAHNGGKISTLTASGSIDTGVASLVGSASINEISNKTNSFVDNSDISLGESLNINAIDDTSINSSAGEIEVSKGVGIASSVLHNKITNTLNAYIKDSANIKSKNLTLRAISNKHIITTALSGAAGKSGAGDGSILINTVKDNINSYIKNSIVGVNNSLLVHAIAQNKITSYGGTASGAGTLGIGGTVVVNNIANNLNSYIVNSSVDVGGFGFLDIPTDEDYTKVENFYGLSLLSLVNEDVKVYTANLSGAGTAAFTASANYNNIANKLHSYILASQINQNNTLKQDIKQSVSVKAINNSYLNIKGGAISGAGTLGLGASLNVNYIKNITKAYIDDSFVNGENLVEVKTTSTESIDSDVFAGAGAGAGAVSGAVSIISIANENEARINTSTVFSKNDLNVISKDIVTLNVNAGALSGSGGIGVGASTAINSIKNNTLAYVYDSTLNAKNMLYVSSLNDVTLNNKIASGAVGKFGGAGSALINTVDSLTKSYIYQENIPKILINQNPSFESKNQSIKIEAVDNVKVNNKVGSLGLGLAGIGASFDVTTLKNDTDAYLGENALVFAKKDLDIIAKSTKDFSSLSAAFGGGAIGVSGSVVIANFGLSLSELALKSIEHTNPILNKILDSLDNVKLGTSSFASNTKNSLINSKKSINLTKIFEHQANKTKAHINANSKINVGNNLNIKAENSILKLDIKSGEAAIGAVGVGGSVAFASLGARNCAYTQDDVTVDAKDITIEALFSPQNIKIKSYAGSAGMVGVGADLSQVLSVYNNSAIVGGNNLLVTYGGLNVKAITDENIQVRAYGANVGARVAGVSIASVTTKGFTTSKIAKNSRLHAQGSEGINILSSYNTSVDAYATSAAAGASSDNGVTSEIMLDSSVLSEVDDKVKLGTSIGDININTLYTNKLYSKAKGLSIAGVNVGSSVAKASSNVHIDSVIGNNVLINAYNDLKILTYENRDIDSGTKIESNLIQAYAVSSTGSLLGKIGSKSTATSHSFLRTQIGESTNLNAQGDIIIKTEAYSKTKSISNGHSYGLASHGSTQAYSLNGGGAEIFIKRNTNLVGGNILLNTYAQKNIDSTSKGGTGGAVNVSGTKADAQISNLVNINILDDTKINANNGDVNILATGNIDVKVLASTTSSGAVSDNHVSSNVKINKSDIKINIGKSAIYGNNINIKSQLERLYATSTSMSKTKAAGSHSRAYSHLSATSNVGVNLSNAIIIGNYDINIEANQDTNNVLLKTKATSTISKSLIGNLYATVENNPTFKSNITINNDTHVVANKINIKGSVPTENNYIKDAEIINHSVEYWAEQRVWHLLRWITRKKLKHHISSSKAIEKGTFRVQKKINAKDNVRYSNRHINKEDKTFRKIIKDRQIVDFANWNPESIHGLNARVRKISPLSKYHPFYANVTIKTQLNSAYNNSSYKIDKGIFANVDIDKIPDMYKVTSLMSVTEKDYLPSYAQMIEMHKDRPWVIIDNSLLGGTLFTPYIEMMTVKKVNSNFQLELPKLPKKEELLSMN